MVLDSVRPAGRPRPGVRALTSLGVILAAMAAWEASKAVWRIPDFKLPHSYAILAELIRRTGDGELWLVVLARNALVTGGEALVGFLMGGLAGFLIAVVFIHWPLAEQGLSPYVVASQTVPILAIAPMVVVWVGTGWLSKAIIASYLTFFPVTVNMSRGLRAVDTDELALMRALSASSRQVLFKLRLPASLPYLFTALRISATASVIGAIVGELPVGSRYGMGVVIINAAQYYNWRPANLWAAILVSAVIGIVFYHAVAAVERSVVSWSRTAPAI